LQVVNLDESCYCHLCQVNKLARDSTNMHASSAMSQRARRPCRP
jgi:hypothetical protein